ncbi:PIN-like domain-containing protein [Pantoea rwandensis]|uniref:PIN like domain-containing protein n=1 Tax=Pantoea rwandensis TaxID=1076550 RepID=A0A1X1CXS9_9GAMM|nr:PIN-like domain-containing protein [Pantoea rwandensis]ORM69111.1 hypothetical protein HA51_12630 [Pantoea rwandensis]
MWKEIIEKSKSDDIKDVIFVCDDQKEDWYFELSGRKHGVLESLTTEICREANLKSFKLITQLTFLHEAKSYLNNINIRDSSLKEVEELSQVVRNEFIEVKKRKRRSQIKEFYFNSLGGLGETHYSSGDNINSHADFSK